jgi:hypothetical protein
VLELTSSLVLHKGTLHHNCLLALMQDLAGSGQMVKGIANAMTPIWKSQDDSEAPSVVFSSSERASRAQVYTALHFSCFACCYVYLYLFDMT